MPNRPPRCAAPRIIVVALIHLLQGPAMGDPNSITTTTIPSLFPNQDSCARFMTGGMPGMNSFASPNYPEPYPPNVDCVRLIQAPIGYDVLLRFKGPFGVETAYADSVGPPAAVAPVANCPNDYLVVRDGRYSFSPLLARLCGMGPPAFEIRARSGFLWLHFHSDNLLQYGGFSAEYEFLREEAGTGAGAVGEVKRNGKFMPNKCHFSFALPLDGYINLASLRESYTSSPTPTSPPPPPLDCVWHVQVPRWLSVAVFIEDFQLASPNQCHENFLELYAGPISNTPTKKYCGLTATHAYTGQSEVFIRFFGLGPAQVNGSRIQLLFSTYVALKNCSEHHLFSCGDDVCIAPSLVCNGKANCLYRKDEAKCEREGDLLESLLDSSYIPMCTALLLISLVVGGLCCYYRPFRQSRQNVEAYLKEMAAQRVRAATASATTAIVNNHQPSPCRGLKDDPEMIVLSGTSLLDCSSTLVTEIEASSRGIGLSRPPSPTASLTRSLWTLSDTSTTLDTKLHHNHCRNFKGNAHTPTGNGNLRAAKSHGELTLVVEKGARGRRRHHHPQINTSTANHLHRLEMCNSTIQMPLRTRVLYVPKWSLRPIDGYGHGWKGSTSNNHYHGHMETSFTSSSTTLSKTTKVISV